MNYWLLMFRPETFEKVKAHGVIGVNANQEKRIQGVREGDKFVAYVSRKQVLDAVGTFTSGAFVETTPVFGVREVYPYRARVRFDKTGCDRDARVALWGLSDFESGLKTTPSNMLFCRGGFMTITKADFDFLGTVLDGTWSPPNDQ